MQDLKPATTKAVNFTLSLGDGTFMLNLVVNVHAAVGEDKASALRTVCHSGHDPIGIKTTQTCPQCGNSENASFGRAATVGGDLVFIPKEIIEGQKDADAAIKTAVAVTVHPAPDVTSVLLPSGKTYYLALAEDAPQGYVWAYRMLVGLLTTRPDLAFMTRLTLRTAASLMRLVVVGEGTLALQQMADADLVRKHPVIGAATVDSKALKLASELAGLEATAFDVDVHGVGGSHLIAEYAAAQVAAKLPQPVGATVMDLTAALAASVAAAKKAAAPARKVPAARKTASAARSSAGTPANPRVPARKTAAKVAAKTTTTRARKVS